MDGRGATELRPLSFELGYTKHAEGSVLVSLGETRVLCNASIQDGVPPWMANQGKAGGWITAEYGMLPRATHTRSQRETRGPSGRSQEIQRLIGRSLRSSFDLGLIGKRTISLDCDVLQADGGTRTASIIGAYVALRVAVAELVKKRQLSRDVFLEPVAAISVGLVDGKALLDLCYLEDSSADADMNVVMNAQGEFIEVQGTAEGKPFSRARLDSLLEIAASGIKQILAAQRKALESA